MEELKPCPFCGKIPTMWTMYSGNIQEEEVFLVRCGAYECNIKPETPVYISRRLAVAAWNWRTVIPASGGERP